MLLLALLAAIVYLELAYSGAMQAGVTANPDEAAHYVTSLMIQAYLRDGLTTSPRQFAESYYLHYPKVAFGVWPPLVHAALGAWMLVASATPASALIFLGLTLVVLAYVLFRTAAPHVETAFAAAAAVWFVLLPTVQRTAGSILLDIPCALLMVCATIAFGRYLDSHRWQDACLFGFLASAALLTKNNAAAIALIPPIAVAMSRKWFLFKRWSFWAPVAIVSAICVPWYLFTWNLLEYAAGLAGDTLSAPCQNLVLLVREPGVLFVPFALIGIGKTVGRGATNGVWNCLFALLLSVWLFHSIAYPTVSPRYLLAAYAASILFCIAGVDGLVARTIAFKTHARAILAVALTAAFLVSGFPWQKKLRRGFVAAADVMLADGLQKNATALVCSDSIGEGSFVAAVATTEQHPRTIVLRASKLLAESGWNGANYAPKHDDSHSLSEALLRARVEYVAVDAVEDSPHHRMLMRALRESPDWLLVRAVDPGVPAPEHSTVELYRRMTDLPPGPPDFEINLRDSVGKTLQP